MASCVRPDRHPVPAPARSAGCNSIAAQNGRFETAVESGWAGLRRLTRQHVLHRSRRPLPRVRPALGRPAARTLAADRRQRRGLTTRTAPTRGVGRRAHGRARDPGTVRVCSLSHCTSARTPSSARSVEQHRSRPDSAANPKARKRNGAPKQTGGHGQNHSGGHPLAGGGAADGPARAGREKRAAAVIAAVVDIVWFVYTYVQAQKMNTPVKPEVASRSLLQLWENA